MSDEDVVPPGEPQMQAAPEAEDAGGAALPEAGVPDATGAVPADGGEDLGALKEVLEALVFVHRGILPPRTVREVLGEEYSAEQIEAGFAALAAEYAARGGAVVLLEVAGGYQLGTRPDLAPWIQKLDFYEHHRHLSKPTLETLAIIAYKQPVTRAEIEAIRGVNVERIVRNLIERKLVRILGHKDVPGKPMVLGTTKEFLELFGLSSLAALPPLKEFIEPPSPEGIEEEAPAPAGEQPEAGAGAAVEAQGQEPEQSADGGEDGREGSEAGGQPPETAGEDGGDGAPGGAG